MLKGLFPMPESGYTSNEIMTIAAARRLANGMVCFVGIGMPSAAANLARNTHAPEVVLIYESGTIGAKPTVLPLSIGDGELAETADAIVSVPEIFRYWLQSGRVDVGFLGAAQIDKYGNINTTVIGGTYASPQVRLPGAGGASEIATAAKEVWIILKQTKRTFVENLHFVTSAGHQPGPQPSHQPGHMDSEHSIAAQRRRSGRGRGPTVVITDLGVLVPDPITSEFRLSALHPGVTIEQARAMTGWDLKVAPNLEQTPEPTDLELTALRDLYARTEVAHGSAMSDG
jgi:glutaconate CoA-transferase, subunit B